METLYLRAEPKTIEAIMHLVNQFAQAGEQIEVLDNVCLEKEAAMIVKGLDQAKKGETVAHDFLWNELLKP